MNAPKMEGIDGLPLEAEAEDEAQSDKRKALEALTKSRTWLGREFLTWLLWRSESGDSLTQHDGEPVTVLVVGKVALRGLAGEATELNVKGHLSAYSEVVRYALAKGLLVHSARLRISHGERIYEATVDAERLDIRSATLPEALGEAEDDRLTERLWLVEALGRLLEALWGSFAEARGKGWNQTVKQMRAWFES